MRNVKLNSRQAFRFWQWHPSIIFNKYSNLERRRLFKSKTLPVDKLVLSRIGNSLARASSDGRSIPLASSSPLRGESQFNTERTPLPQIRLIEINLLHLGAVQRSLKFHNLGRGRRESFNELNVLISIRLFIFSTNSSLKSTKFLLIEVEIRDYFKWRKFLQNI